MGLVSGTRLSYLYAFCLWSVASVLAVFVLSILSVWFCDFAGAADLELACSLCAEDDVLLMDSFLFFCVDGMYGNFAGRDASRGMAKQSFDLGTCSFPFLSGSFDADTGYCSTHRLSRITFFLHRLVYSPHFILVGFILHCTPC
jgi:hypothetical protein